jgi:hypothetical protein
MQRITVPGQPKQIVQETPISKITRAKWTGGMAQAIEHLLCKCEALSSNPSLTKKKKILVPHPAKKERTNHFRWPVCLQESGSFSSLQDQGTNRYLGQKSRYILL